MPYFDFHCHPGLKPQFSDTNTKPSPWQFIDAKLVISRNINIAINPLFNEVLNSQSNLSQLVQSDVKLIGLILHAPEKKIAQALSEKSIVNKGMVNLIDKNQLSLLATGLHSFALINEELRWLQESVPEINNAKLVILNNANDYNENAPKTVFGVIIVEGLHCFFDDPNAIDAKEIFTQNFNFFTDTHAVVSINLCHMQQNPFCNHAHGIQFFNPPYFYPTKTGITLWGKEVIEMMLSKNILIDIKHMSLKARLELYTWFREDETTFLQPIICTHAGTTGIKIIDRAKYLLHQPIHRGEVYEVSYLKPQSIHDKETYHNCSSINLYDEDIEHILLSSGIIGLSFDQRILGFADENVLLGVTTPHDVEFISNMEAGFFLGPNPLGLPIKNDNDGVWASEDFENLDPSLYSEMHCRFLVNNIIHILWVANKHPLLSIKKAAKQICIGTDFDGLINAIDCCKNAIQLPQLKANLKVVLQQMLFSEGFATLDAGNLLEDIFYTNGKNFMLNRLKAIKPD